MSLESIKRWEVQSSTGKHFDVLDGIRGVAILMVVAFHTFYTNPTSNEIVLAVGGLIGAGWIGVPIFFVLSGFLISYPFFRARSDDVGFWYQRGYVRRRVGKILPPYYLSIALFGAYYYLRYADVAYLRAALQWALGFANFIPTECRFNASYWSLLIEVHFYILLPVLFLVTRGLKTRKTAVWLFAILFVVPLIVRQITWPAPGAGKDAIAFLMSRFPCQLDYFAWGVLFSGMFVALGTRRDEMRTWIYFGYFGMTLLIVSLSCWALWSRLFEISSHPTRWSVEAFHLLPSLAAFFLLFFVFDPQCAGVRLLSHPWLRFIGIVSYEWFLLHQPIVYLFQDVIGQTRGNLLFYFLKTIVPLILTFGLSVMIYRYFSLPLMNRIRGQS